MTRCAGVIEVVPASAVVHVSFRALNTVNYFYERYDFAWRRALQSFFMGLCQGVLRTRMDWVTVAARFPILLRG